MGVGGLQLAAGTLYWGFSIKIMLRISIPLLGDCH
jgi:hypothetical protein